MKEYVGIRGKYDEICDKELVGKYKGNTKKYERINKSLYTPIGPGTWKNSAPSSVGWGGGSQFMG